MANTRASSALPCRALNRYSLTWLAFGELIQSIIIQEALSVSRQVLEQTAISPAIGARIGGAYEETISEVKNALVSSAVVVVGMAQNPYCKKVRKQLDSVNISYSYLEYGSYLKQWQRRLALKVWTGWPTFPMVFVNGVLQGGNQEVESLLASGELQRMLDSAAS